MNSQLRIMLLLFSLLYQAPLLPAKCCPLILSWFTPSSSFLRKIERPWFYWGDSAWDVLSRQVLLHTVNRYDEKNTRHLLSFCFITLFLSIAPHALWILVKRNLDSSTADSADSDTATLEKDRAALADIVGRGLCGFHFRFELRWMRVPILDIPRGRHGEGRTPRGSCRH
ncbi:hypothetical protein B0O99DRAFT_333467 [Bisporella sp. PMI_857]|nr:hypothetical protein B0O99DRAFT_333467 [Bisporella sp. PMI_857]